MPYTLTREQLLEDLRTAYIDARRHKRSKPYQQRFEAHAESNLSELCDELYSRAYKPRPSSCFIITDPKRREVFAAEFRDRIVHHLYYNYTHELYERTFIHDTYSCIKGRGTHFGVSRLEQHIRSESRNYTRPCYIMKMDIRGYFMHIDRERLLNEGKFRVTSARHGVEFLGAWLKPHRVYATRGTVGRMLSKLRLLAESDRSRWSASLNSFCGVLSHGANYRLRRRLMLAVPAFTKYGVFDMEYRRYFSL